MLQRFAVLTITAAFACLAYGRNYRDPTFSNVEADTLIDSLLASGTDSVLVFKATSPGFNRVLHEPDKATQKELDSIECQTKEFFFVLWKKHGSLFGRKFHPCFRYAEQILHGVEIRFRHFSRPPMVRPFTYRKKRHTQSMYRDHDHIIEFCLLTRYGKNKGVIGRFDLQLKEDNKRNINHWYNCNLPEVRSALLIEQLLSGAVF